MISPGFAAAGPDTRFDWPLRPHPVVGRPFDPPEQDWLPGHRGVDLAGTRGQAVYAAGPGTVVFAGKVAGKPVVAILHAGGLRTTYEPVEGEVRVGRRVTRDTRIGELAAGHGGCAAPACLHWGLRRESTAHASREYLDPLGLLRRTPIRLKPVEPDRPGGN
ncbi:M23 family metallopeptidase [Nocardia sp. NBC_01329]|nr:M23 family metallopeptidase [Nocardia sp. NBC_01329]